MSERLDMMLERLSREPVPARLSMTDSLVLQQVAGHSFQSHVDSSGFRAIAITAALFMGIAGGLISERPAGSKQSLSPFIGAEDLAPSTLLADNP